MCEALNLFTEQSSHSEQKRYTWGYLGWKVLSKGVHYYIITREQDIYNIIAREQDIYDIILREQDIYDIIA